MKRLLSVLLALALACSIAGCAPAAEPEPETTEPAAGTPAPSAGTEDEAPALGYTPGTYAGSAQGMWGEITVDVTVEEDAITAITVTSCQDTEYLANAAIEEMPEKILAAQSLAVDTTAGATMSSRGILSAVEAALTEAGGDMDALTAARPETGETLPDESFDIVVVGGGGAGLSAAMWAAKISDASVLLLEQNAMTGGATALSGGGISAGGSAINGKNGLPDYTGKELADFFVAHTESLDYLPEDVTINPALVERIGDQAGEVFDYLCEQGYTYNAANLKAFGSDPGRGVTGCLAVPDAAAMWGTWYTDLAKKNGAEVRTNSKVVGLLIEDGAVVGVEVKTPEGHYNVAAKKVILATGGFANDMELLKEKNADLPGLENAWSFTAGGLTGSVFDLVEPLNVPARGYGMLCDLGTLPPYGTCTDLGNVVINGLFCYVDGNGERFTDPSKVQYGRTYDMLRLEDSVAYTISSAGSTQVLGSEPRSVAEYAEQMKEIGACYEADTLEELAALIGADPENLAASVAAHNEEARNGKLAFYGSALDVVEEGGPYYAFPLKVCVLATLYGIELNEQFQVVNESGEAVPNLYAAGECAMGNYIVGEYPCGTMSLTCAIYGGTLAAEEAVAAMENA